MPANLQTLLNIWGQGVRMERLLRSPQWRQGVAGLRRVVYELGQTIRQMQTQQQQQSKQPATQPQRGEDGMFSETEELVNLANRLDASGAHAMADVLDVATAEMRKEADKNFQAFYKEVQEIQNALMNTTVPDVKGFVDNKMVRRWIFDLGKTLSKYEAASGVVNRFGSIANRLDEQGKHILADAMDNAAHIVRAFGFEKKKPEPEAPIKPSHLTPLSSRYCPDHRGAQMARVGDRIFQCPVDRKTYNFENGYTNYQGQRVPGGSIAGQTPAASNYSGVPHRIFDTRENILNTLN